ncbi:hypothetical protein DXG03_008326, partial [Asterophora parasitica]
AVKGKGFWQAQQQGPALFSHANPAVTLKPLPQTAILVHLHNQLGTQACIKAYRNAGSSTCTLFLVIFRTMRLVRLLLAVPLFVVQTSAVVIGSNIIGSIKALAPAQACGDPRTAVPLLRAWSASATDHFYTTNAAEMQNAVTRGGYVAEGTTGYVFSRPQPNTVPLFRLYNTNNKDHFYTTNAAERNNAVGKLGYASEGIVGFVYSSTACGAQPLYRSYQGGVVDHFYTMSAGERSNAKGAGWAAEGVAAFIFPY